MDETIVNTLSELLEKWLDNLGGSPMLPAGKFPWLSSCKALWVQTPVRNNGIRHRDQPAFCCLGCLTGGPTPGQQLGEIVYLRHDKTSLPVECSSEPIREGDRVRNRS